MARSINIEPLQFHNIEVFEDAIKVKYDTNKTNQSGESCTYKHLYGNPLKPEVCVFTSLGIYLAINSGNYVETEYLFHRTADESDKVASHRYCTQLSQILKEKADLVKLYVRILHENAHGLRKGGATYATSGTTAPPPIPSVARRGEWCMGKALQDLLALRRTRGLLPGKSTGQHRS